jgi:hypothetical protein
MIFLGMVGLSILFAGITTMLMDPVEKAWNETSREIHRDMVDLEMRNRSEIIGTNSTVKDIDGTKYGVVALKKFIKHFNGNIYVVIWHGAGLSHDALFRLFEIRGDFSDYEQQLIRHTFGALRGTGSYITVCTVEDIKPVLF